MGKPAEHIYRYDVFGIPTVHIVWFRNVNIKISLFSERCANYRKTFSSITLQRDDKKVSLVLQLIQYGHSEYQ